jgi:hypothetical protein
MGVQGNVQVRGGNLLNFRGDALLLFHHSDVRPLKGSVALVDWRLNAAVSILWKRKRELLRFGQLTVVATQGKLPSETIILAGLGLSDEFSADLRREIYRLAVKSAVSLGLSRVAVQGVVVGDEKEGQSLDDLGLALESVKGAGSLNVSLFPGHRDPITPSADLEAGTAKTG